MCFVACRAKAHDRTQVTPPGRATARALFSSSRPVGFFASFTSIVVRVPMTKRVIQKSSASENQTGELSSSETSALQEQANAKTTGKGADRQAPIDASRGATPP